MFMMKIIRKGGLPAIDMDDTLAASINSVKENLDDDELPKWESIKKDLETKKKWSDEKTTITITEVDLKKGSR